MIDPINSLAFSVHANRGVYALLLGSGVSRAAKIPTGWEITRDLIRPLAAVSNERPASPEAWYREKYDKDPDYSALLEDLAKTPAERQQLLRPYWEPTPEEREQGDKAPTAAHRAIAKLVADGYIKVIITTNFDRLIESALTDEGVQPQVLGTVDQINGAVPIVHAPCTVLKLHGDYLDTRIRNTPQELEKYPEEYNRLLDRIFDEFGLIVCGWSAEWDTALRDSIYRTASRRYTTYWTVHDELGDRGQALIAHRKAEKIPIRDADWFFQTLGEQVASIEDFSRPHPLSTEIAVATVKRLLPHEQFDIRLHDLVNDLVKRVVQGASGPDFSVNATVDAKGLNAKICRYNALCKTLVAVAAVSGYWYEPRHYSLWTKALSALMELQRRPTAGQERLNLLRYPATLLLYSLGVGALAHQKFDLLGELLALRTGADEEKCVSELLAPSWLADPIFMQKLDGMSGHPLPLNDWIFQEIRTPLRAVVPDSSAYERVFDELEMLLALNYQYREYRERRPNPHLDDLPALTLYGHALDALYGDGERNPPPGCFVFREEQKCRNILKGIEKSIAAEGDTSPYVESRIFGDTADWCGAHLSNFKKYIDGQRQSPMEL